MVHSSGAVCVHVCVCFSSAFMIRFSPCNVLLGDYIGHPRWELLCSCFTVHFLGLWEQVNIFWGYWEVLPETMRVWNLLEGETGSCFSFFSFFFFSWFDLHIFIFALTPFYHVLTFPPMGKRTHKRCLKNITYMD